MNNILQAQINLINCQENQMDDHQSHQFAAIAAHSLANLWEGAPFVSLSLPLLAIHHFLMQAQGATTMARKKKDDGDILRTVKLVSNNLTLLVAGNGGNAPHRSCSSSSSFSSFSSSSSSLLLLSCTREGGMDLSWQTTNKLMRALVPMVRVLGGIDAAALLLLTPVIAVNKAKEKDRMGGGGGGHPQSSPRPDHVTNT
jgi:hypothetical protein